MPMADRYQPKSGPPRSLIDKLGVKPGAKVSVVGVRDAGFWRELRGRTHELSEGGPAQGSDVIVFGAERASDLRRVASLARSLKPDGGLWVVTLKRTEGLRDVDVIAAAKAAGLVDNKVVRFSETHTALRLVIPRERRVLLEPSLGAPSGGSTRRASRSRRGQRLGT